MGKSRRAFIVSPAEYVQYCQPSYAHRTLIIAKPKPDNLELKRAGGAPSLLPTWKLLPSQSSSAPIAKIATIFTAVVRFCRSALWRVPRTFTNAITAIIASDTSLALEELNE